MTTSEPDTLPPRFQFRILHLLLATLLLSIFFTILLYIPDWLASAIMIVGAIFLAASVTAAIVYSSGYTRAFCIGALFPIALVAVTAGCLFVVITFDAFRNDYDDILRELERSASGMRFAVTSGWLSAPIAGILSVLVRISLVRPHS